MISKLMIIFLCIFSFYFLKNFKNLNRKKKDFNTKKFLKFDKKNLDKWMNLTKKERYNLSKQESIKYYNKRKLLLEEIRKEYKRISKGKSY